MSSGDSLAAIQDHFESAGGRFATAAADIAAALAQCRGVVFDWDGVFTPGRKSEQAHSDFSEADSMGTNMLRYGMWRALGHLPFVAVISGERNPTAAYLAGREHFNAVFTGIRNKGEALDRIASEHGVTAEQLICVFDDINDLGMASRCRVRAMVRRNASPLLADYATRNGLCDYVTGSEDHAVREVCELLLGLMGTFDDVVRSRVAFDDEYQSYFAARQAVECQT